MNTTSPATANELPTRVRSRSAAERNTARCGCDGHGQVHHHEGALSFVTRCGDRDCILRRDAEFMGVSREDIERYFGPVAS